MCVTPKILDRALADHEAGHLVISVILNRGLKQVSLDNVDGVRGCFYLEVDEANWDDFREMLCLLAGPRAQAELCPESLTADQRVRFSQTINQPRQSLWVIPAGYDGTYWGPDMDYLYTYLAMPNAPAMGLAWGIQRQDVVTRAEIRLKAFFNDDERHTLCRRVADILKEKRSLPGLEATTLVQQYFDLELSRTLLAWD